MTDPLDAICREMLAETMLPCRELSDETKADIAAAALVRNEQLAAWYGRDELRLRAV